MNDLNSIHLEGTVSKNPIHRTTKKGDMVCSFSVATNRFFKSPAGETEKETSLFDIEPWGEEAGKCKRLAHKGRRCRVTGRIRQDRWNTPEGDPRSKVVVVAEFVEFRPEKKQEGGNHERD
jgi:single-strand DNA-binding protein